MHLTLTNSPQALANIDNGTRYTLVNKSSNTMYVEITDTAPTHTRNAFPVGPGSYGLARKDSGQEIYVWTGNNPNGIVTYGPAA